MREDILVSILLTNWERDSTIFFTSSMDDMYAGVCYGTTGSIEEVSQEEPNMISVLRGIC
jgi:hypothetical protein